MLALNHSDLTLRVGSIAVLCIYWPVILLLLGILSLRFTRLAKERRRRSVTETWRPLLAQCVVEMPTHPAPAQASRPCVFSLFVEPLF